MGKLFGIVLIAVATYLGLTIYEKGIDGAFGGLFAASPARVAQPIAAEAEAERASAGRRDDAPSDAPAPRPVTQRVRERVTGAMEQGSRRNGP